MKRSAIRFSVVLTGWFLLVNGASGQQATEVYIPIGESPGVSASESLTGVIRSVDYAARSIEVQGHDGVRAVSVNDKTRYYLDRSTQRRKNSLGTLHDCEKGRTIEAKIMVNDIAEWVKIEMD